ncbi:alpha/beta hydrolase [Kiloniella antarctica]|uniref:Alpha/beta hydrolase n=1 Tax=Kiloniella antarctica TaxID=1550907 RepID=A0ABW5BMQ0_9PROT
MNWILFAATFYIVVLVAMYLLQTRLVYPGSDLRSKPEAYGGVGVQEIQLKMADEVQLTHWFIPPRKKHYPVVVAFHGNAGHTGDRLAKLKYFTEMGFGLFQVEYRGYAGHEGTPSEQAFKADGLSALKWLSEQGYNKDKLIMYGESLGTGMAVWLGSQFPVQAVILEAPYSSIADVAQAKYWFLPVKYLLKDKWRSDLSIQDVKAPVFLFHGENDEVIPIALSRKLFELIPNDKQAIYFEDGYHMDLYDHGAEKNVREFLQEFVIGKLNTSSP